MSLYLLCLGGIAAGQSYQKRIPPIDAAYAQAFEAQPKIAILVGVGEYSDASGLASLKYPAKDVAELASEFEKQGYVVKTLVNIEATRGLVVRTLNQMSEPGSEGAGRFCSISRATDSPRQRALITWYPSQRQWTISSATVSP